MNRLSITVELAADGGCVVYADNGGTEQALVFAGNTKDTCDYIAKRVGVLKAEHPSKEFLEFDADLRKYRLKPEFDVASQFAVEA